MAHRSLGAPQPVGLHALGCVGCGSDHVTSTGTSPQTHRCHDCALVWLNTDPITTLHARIKLHHQTPLRRAA